MFGFQSVGLSLCEISDICICLLRLQMISAQLSEVKCWRKRSRSRTAVWQLYHRYDIVTPWSLSSRIRGAKEKTQGLQACGHAQDLIAMLS